MKVPAWYINGYESHEGQLELLPESLVFSRKKDNRAGTFAAFGLIGLALSNPFEQMMAVPRFEIRGTYPSQNNMNEFAVYTTRGMLVFNVPNRDAWMQALGPLPPGG